MIKLKDVKKLASLGVKSISLGQDDLRSVFQQVLRNKEEYSACKSCLILGKIKIINDDCTDLQICQCPIEQIEVSGCDLIGQCHCKLCGKTHPLFEKLNQLIQEIIQLKGTK